MSDFSDLRARVTSAVAMVAVGAVAVWAGGHLFAALGIVLAGLMAWELHRMLAPSEPPVQAQAIGTAAALLVAVAVYWQPNVAGMALVVLGGGALSLRMARDRVLFGAYMALILFAVLGLILLREALGAVVVLWLVLVVIASDVAGYFAGRLIGGPKFWPRVSPKKTWSGTVAGWICAAAVGAGFAAVLPVSWTIVPVSVALAFAGQMGDIAESAIKRHAGVKDSSSLIPGHGGVLDRFDAMIAVGALALVMGVTGMIAGLAG